MTYVPTPYKQVRFERRSAARWAVYFDALHITWQYDGSLFFLPQVDMYADVMTSGITKKRVKEADQRWDATKKPTLLLDMPPFISNYWAREDGDWIDYLIGYKGYHTTENRFFRESGVEYPQRVTALYDHDMQDASETALNHKFDYGDW